MVTTTKIGSLEVTALVDHVPPPRDLQAIYPDVPADAWDPYRDFALDSDGRWQTQYCAFLIRPAFGTGSTVLVDAGLGAGPHEPGDSPGKLLGELGDTLIFMHFRVFRYGDTKDRTVHYTIYQVKKSDVDWSKKTKK